MAVTKTCGGCRWLGGARALALAGVFGGCSLAAAGAVAVVTAAVDAAAVVAVAVGTDAAIVEITGGGLRTRSLLGREATQRSG